MANLFKLSAIKINGVEIDAYVDESGRFHASFEEENYHAYSVSDLTERLGKAIKTRETKPAAYTIPVSILNFDSFSRLDGFPSIIHAVLRGEHASRRRAFLFLSDEGKKFTVEVAYHNNPVCRRLTTEETATFTRLLAEREAAHRALEVFCDEASVSPEDLLNTARKA